MKGKESRVALWESVRGTQGGGSSASLFTQDRGTVHLSYSNERIRQMNRPPVFPGINTLATDHCPFQTFEKDRGINDFTMIPNGVMGVENLYPYMLSEANKGNLSFERVIELCSANPAKIFGLAPAKGAITPGADADIVIYDPAKDFTISQKNMHSTINYTIWEGLKLKGYPVRTYARGSLIYKDGEFLGKPGTGRFISILTLQQTRQFNQDLVHHAGSG